jgi:anti-sigma factor RsiW
MMHSEEPEQRPNPADRSLWQRCRVLDAAEDETARLLDLAAYADRLLDVEEEERVAALLAADPEAAADVAAARALASAEPMSAGLEHMIARASAIPTDADPEFARVVPLARWRGRRVVEVFAEWGSIAAAVALASWLGFAMGSDTSRALSEPRQPNDTTFLPELFDPAPSFLRDLGEGMRT